MVKGTRWEMPPDLPSGKYVWQVRGLLSDDARSPASIAKDSTRQEVTSWHFTIEKELFQPSVQVTLGGMAAPLSYDGKSATTTQKTSVISHLFSLSLDARVAIGGNRFVAFGLEHTLLSEVGGDHHVSLGDIRLGLGKWLVPARPDDPWSITGSLAARYRDYLELHQGFLGNLFWRQINSYGLDLELIVRRHFSQRASAGATFRYYLPMGLLYAPSVAVSGGVPVGPENRWGGALAGELTWTNLAAALDFTYWVSSRLGVVATVGAESRGLSYRRNPDLSPERLFLFSAHGGIKIFCAFP